MSLPPDEVDLFAPRLKKIHGDFSSRIAIQLTKSCPPARSPTTPRPTNNGSSATTDGSSALSLDTLGQILADKLNTLLLLLPTTDTEMCSTSLSVEPEIRCETRRKGFINFFISNSSETTPTLKSTTTQQQQPNQHIKQQHACRNIGTPYQLLFNVHETQHTSPPSFQCSYIDRHLYTHLRRIMKCSCIHTL
eukprot:GHVQ01040478.1.p1 GENE.GHVQ01040478.1~~GHVQ01040478.1.p1  ORF type:complete len:192 (-),score=27.99 GHVQ01040478.1:116-691(-)